MPAMDSMKRYIKRYGIPQSVYLDKHSTYKSWAEPTIEEQLNGQRPMSHFEKSLDEMVIEVIHSVAAVQHRLPRSMDVPDEGLA